MLGESRVLWVIYMRRAKDREADGDAAANWLGSIECGFGGDEETLLDVGAAALAGRLPRDDSRTVEQNSDRCALFAA